MELYQRSRRGCYINSPANPGVPEKKAYGMKQWAKKMGHHSWAVMIRVYKKPVLCLLIPNHGHVDQAAFSYPGMCLSNIHEV